MKLLILGSTGRIGQHIALIAASSSHSHSITLYVRDQSRLAAPIKALVDDNIRIVTGTLDDTAALLTAITGQDAILSALGPNVFYGSKGAIPRAYRNVLEIMRAEGVRRIVALGTPDIYHARDERSVKRTMAYYAASLVGGRAAQRELKEVGGIFGQEDTCKDGGGIDWTVYRVAVLLDSEREQEIRADWVGVPDYGLILRRRDCARWVVEEVEKGEHSEWIGGMPALWSTGREVV